MKLSVKQVKQLKADIAGGKLTQPELAKKHHISRSTVSDVATERLHKDVPWPGRKPVRLAGGQRKNANLDVQLQEANAEIECLRQELHQANRQVKLSTKQHGLFRAVVNEMDARIMPFPPLPGVKLSRRADTIEEHLVAHLSDGHHDQIVSLEESQGLEFYNWDVTCRRAENYVDTLIDWSQRTLANRFHFPCLHILAYGDHTSGEIHGACTRSAFKNQFKNCFAIGQLHARMFRDLAPFFPSINVVYVPGNHGRRSIKKDYHGAQDNWDYMIAEVARLHCSNIENISFTIPNAFSVNLDINGVGFNISHGDDVKGHQGIPWYGMVRRQKNLIALGQMQSGPPIRYSCMGHHHVQGSVADVQGELFLNGAWLGTDSYAYNSFAGFREPTQWLHGVNDKYGVTWRMGMRLRSADDKYGPKRYHISV